MFLRSTIVKYSTVILMGALIFYIDSFEGVNALFTKSLILALVLFKSVFFFIQNYKKIIEVTINNVAYHNFLLFMALNIILIVLSFGIDFLCLYQVDPYSFRGIPDGSDFSHRCFEFLYFSALNFANFGFDEILPVGIFARSIVLVEIIIYFIAVIFILSDFVSLKESFSNARVLRKHKQMSKEI